MDSDWTPGNCLTGCVSRSDHGGCARATWNELVASGEMAGGEREASSREAPVTTPFPLPRRPDL